jgi:four helix bundle protein
MTEKMDGFESLDIWKKGIDICIIIYKTFEKCKDYGLKDQIQRASASVPSNISEGYKRQTKEEFSQFLYIAKGSCGEVRTTYCCL